MMRDWTGFVFPAPSHEGVILTVLGPHRTRGGIWRTTGTGRRERHYTAFQLELFERHLRTYSLSREATYFVADMIAGLNEP